MSQPHCISVDWLQVYTLQSSSNPIKGEGVINSNNYVFSLSTADISSAMFKTIIKVNWKSLPCAIIEINPRSTTLNKRMCLIKLENRILYYTRYVEVLYNLMSALNVTYKGITRIDLCYDCIRFKDGRSPSKFINDYLLKPSTSIGGISRKGSDEFTCHGKKTISSSSRINYISFGSPQSRIRAYIYDKSIELSEVKDKPWIRKTWQENGLICENEDHVFRSEISIKSEGTDMLNMSTGELFRLSPEYLENQKSIEKLFYIYAEKYFFFRRNGGQKRAKDYKRIELFDKDVDITTKPVHLNKSADTGRMEKICYNKLSKLSTMYTDLAEYRTESIKNTMAFLKELEGIKSSTIQAEKYTQYLDNFKGQMFMRSHIDNLLSKQKEAHELELEVLSLLDQARNSADEPNPILEPYYPLVERPTQLCDEALNQLYNTIEYDYENNRINS